MVELSKMMRKKNHHIRWKRRCAEVNKRWMAVLMKKNGGDDGGKRWWWKWWKKDGDDGGGDVINGGDWGKVKNGLICENE